MEQIQDLVHLVVGRGDKVATSPDPRAAVADHEDAHRTTCPISRRIHSGGETGKEGVGILHPGDVLARPEDQGVPADLRIVVAPGSKLAHHADFDLAPVFVFEHAGAVGPYEQRRGIVR